MRPLIFPRFIYAGKTYIPKRVKSYIGVRFVTEKMPFLYRYFRVFGQIISGQPPVIFVQFWNSKNFV